jgi:hypothetical protein
MVFPLFQQQGQPREETSAWLPLVSMFADKPFHNAKLPMAKKQLTHLIKLRLRPDDIPAFNATRRPVWAACAAESGCHSSSTYSPTQRHRGRFRFVEV